MAEPGRAFGTPRHRLISAMAWLCTIISLLNLTGWATGATQLISITPGLPSMVPVTAVLSMLTAGCIVLFAHRAPRSAVFLVAIVSALLCAIIEACYLSGQAPAPFILARSGSEQVKSLSSAMTAGMFLTLHLAVLLSVFTTHIKVAQFGAAAVLLLAVLNLSGYVFRDTFFLRILPTQGTSILTSTVLVLLALATLFLKPHQGLMRAFTGDLPGAVMSRRLLLPTVLIPVTAGVMVSAGERAGLYEAHAVLPLFVWTLVVLFVTVIWCFALHLSAADRARASVQRELRQALDELRLEHERKDVFMATLAHELRNPLAPISAAAEVLRRGGGETVDESRRLGDTIANQITNLITIVNDLLDVERLRTQRIRLEKRRIDIRTVIAEALDQTRPMIARKGHECACRLPDAPVIVRGDRIRLVQILSNLLINAAKYTPAGGRISVSVMALPTVAQIVVQDNGAGMSKELLATLFEPYIQAKVTSDRKEGGLGLGLALAKQLTALHEGELSAHSDGPGKGSRFTLCLPLAYQAASFEAGENASPAVPGVGNCAVLPPACAVTTSGRTGPAG